MVQKLARILGIVLIAVGVLGFVPQAVTDGKLLGIFPVNGVHNGVHIGLGLWGVLAASSVAASINYLRGQALIYAVLTVMGLLPATNMLFGLAPLHGADVGLHAALAAISAWGGWGLAKQTTG
jgi:hypothetical protein